MAFHTSFSGNIAKITDLRTVGKDKTAVIDFTVAVSHRVRDRDSETGWADGTTTFQRVTAWGTLAEHFEETFSVGNRVVVVGTLKTDEDYEDEDGNTVTPRPKVTAESIGADILFGGVSVEKRSKKKKSRSGSSKTTKSRAAESKSKAAPADDEFDDDLFDDDDDF